MNTTDHGHPDVGARVRVKAIEPFSAGFAGAPDKEKFLGAVGIITRNNGWGRCMVRFDDGRTGTFWNGAELEALAEAAKEE